MGLVAWRSAPALDLDLQAYAVANQRQAVSGAEVAAQQLAFEVATADFPRFGGSAGKVGGMQ